MNYETYQDEVAPQDDRIRYEGILNNSKADFKESIWNDLEDYLKHGESYSKEGFANYLLIKEYTK